MNKTNDYPPVRVTGEALLGSPQLLKYLLQDWGVNFFLGEKPEGIASLKAAKFESSLDSSMPQPSPFKEELLSNITQSTAHTGARVKEGHTTTGAINTAIAAEEAQTRSNSNATYTEKDSLDATAHPLKKLQNHMDLYNIVREEITTAHEALKGLNSIDEISDYLTKFKGLAIAKTATNTVVCRGNPQADIVIVGEAPGAEEDLQGKPFVGRSGQLLLKAFRSIGWSDENIFITNMVYWRPPGNRDPSPGELRACRPFVEKIIQLVQPKFIIAVGKVAACNLFEKQEPISKLRASWVAKSFGSDKIDCTAVYHPAYLLRNPRQKRVFWLDLLRISEKINQL